VIDRDRFLALFKQKLAERASRDGLDEPQQARLAELFEEALRNRFVDEHQILARLTEAVAVAPAAAPAEQGGGDAD
jgi:hypothetical protein